MQQQIQCNKSINPKPFYHHHLIFLWNYYIGQIYPRFIKDLLSLINFNLSSKTIPKLMGRKLKMLFLVKSLGGQVIHHDKKEPVYVSFTF